MKVSVVVPAFNEQKLIQQTLRAIKNALSAFHGRGWESELIVCDNNSTDATAAFAREEGAHVVFERINQISRARNAGAAAATGDWLIFVDADSQPSPELFGDVADAIASDRCLAGGCIVHLDVYGPGSRAVISLWNLISRVGRLMAGSFIFCERAAFREIGGFSAEIFAGEELDLSRKLHRLARERRKRIIILTAHPLITSSRKMRLYKPREMIGVFLRGIFSGGRAMKSPEACFPWYDGRR